MMEEVRDESMKGEKKEKKETSAVKELISWCLVILFAVVASKVVTQYLICNAIVPTGSMERTIHVGNRIIGNRLSYIGSEPKRGEIVVFHSPLNDNKLLIKRIIGLPGETVEIKEGSVYIDGSDTPLEEDYINGTWRIENDGYTFEIPEGCYLMLGDNRNNSEDARYWQKYYHKDPYVKREDIIAKAVCVYWPLSDFDLLE